MKVCDEKTLQTQGTDFTREPGKSRSRKETGKAVRERMIWRLVHVPRDVVYILMTLFAVGHASQ